MRAPRLPLVAPDGAAGLLVAAGERGYKHVNLLQTLSNQPAMLRAWCGFTWALRDEPALGRALRELAIMRVADLKNSSYERAHHRRMAIEAGVPEAKLHELANWQDSESFDDVERDVLAYVDAVVASPDVPDAAYGPVARRFDPGQIVELTLTITTYVGIAHFLGALQIRVEDDVASTKDDA